MDSTALTLGGFLGTGLVLGLRHSLDPDHVMAVTAIVSRTRSLKSSTLVGAAWGLGHAFTLLLAGIVVLGLKLTIPAGIADIFEGIVAAALIALGTVTVIRARKDRIHLHAHDHDGKAHVHLHAHAATAGHAHGHMPFFIGMVHGLAGSAALTILAMGAATSLASGLLFIAVFGLGAMLGMLATSTLIGAPLLFASKYARLAAAMPLAAGAASVVLGVVMLTHLTGVLPARL